MSAMMLGLLAETSIHPGSGQDDGTIDLPVQREKTTHYPVIPGSSMKGSLRDYVRRERQEVADGWFGKQEAAGNLLISDGRLLLLPVRSLTGSYRWLTCPHLIERFRRDCARIGLPITGLDCPNLPPEVSSPAVLTEGQEGSKLLLEERSYTITEKAPVALIEALRPLMGDEGARSRLAKQIAIVTDHDFAWFSRYALSIQARNALDETTKISKALWYEETLPPDSLFYTVVATRGQAGSSAVSELEALFSHRPYLQLGGNETIGQGWFRVEILTGVEG